MRGKLNKKSTFVFCKERHRFVLT